MRVQRVHELDVREQFWRLGLPVDVTFMFYDPSSPDQANARKLKSAFPKMKICLCGNDSNIGDMVRHGGDLPPSRWKLPDVMADDFLFEVMLLPVACWDRVEMRHEAV